MTIYASRQRLLVLNDAGLRTHFSQEPVVITSKQTMAGKSPAVFKGFHLLNFAMALLEDGYKASS